MGPAAAAASSPPEQIALLRALVGRDGRRLARELGGPAAHVSAFLRFAHQQHLGAFVYSTLRQLDVADALPPPVLTAARMVAMRELAAGERLRRQLSALRAILVAAGVRALFIKGPLFAGRFYPSVEARGLFDLDILVRADEVARVEAVLIRHGFAPTAPLRLPRALVRRFAHHVEYVRNGVPLDVHWQLQAHFTFAIDYDRVWGTAVRVPLDGETYETASDEYELVLQCLGVVTDLQVGKLKLRSLVDVHHVLRAVDGALEWEAFFAWRARERILRPSLYVLALVLEVLDGHAEFPALSAALARHRPSLPGLRAGIEAAVGSRPRAVAHKLLALRLYEAPLAATLGWWALSLPFRLAIYGVTPRLLNP